MSTITATAPCTQIDVGTGLHQAFAATGSALELGDQPVEFTGLVTLNPDSGTFEAVIADGWGNEHVAEFAAEQGGLVLNLHQRGQTHHEAEWSLENWSMDQTDLTCASLAAVLANPENGLDHRPGGLGHFISTLCPQLSAMGAHARAILTMYPGMDYIGLAAGDLVVHSADRTHIYWIPDTAMAQALEDNASIIQDFALDGQAPFASWDLPGLAGVEA